MFIKSSKEKFNQYRDGWKNLQDFEQNETEGNFIKKDKITSEVSNLEVKIKEFCDDMIIKADKLLSKIQEDDIMSKILYMKLKADYLRYLAEIANEDDFPDILKKARQCYDQAHDWCKDNLSPQDALYLSVVLTYTVFLYFIVDDTRFAFGVADRIYRQAIENLSMNEESKDPEVDILIKRIEENLTIWKIELFDIN